MLNKQYNDDLMSFQTGMTFFIQWNTKGQFRRMFKQLFSIKTTGYQTPKGQNTFKKSTIKRICASVIFIYFLYFFWSLTFTNNCGGTWKYECFFQYVSQKKKKQQG